MAKTSLNTRVLRKSKISVEEDRLSKLPDGVLCQILSNLSTKDLVRCNTLSRRWKNVWLSVSVLVLDSDNFEDDYALFEFVDRFLESNKDLKRFKLIYDAYNEHSHSDFVMMVDEVIKRRVCDLTILNKFDVEEALVRMPLSLYSCATLVNLTLYCVVLDNPESELVSLPCVKTMHLEGVMYDGDSVLETLISSCLVLEDLVVITHLDDYLEVVYVKSQSLKNFKLESLRTECEDPIVKIDAPRLEYMRISDYQSKSFIIHSVGPFAKVSIDVMFDIEFDDPLEITMIRIFFTGISTIHDMIISTRTLEIIRCYSKLEPFPQFSNLTRLDLSIDEAFWDILPTFLDSFPNLHYLVLEFDYYPVKLSYVPQCFLSSLEVVQLNTPITVTDTKLAIYFLRNCAVLEKLMLCESFCNIIMKIKQIPKRSRQCKVVMLQPSEEVVSHTSS